MANKVADFGDDFAKVADFIVAGNNALSDLLVALEQAPGEQADGSVSEIRKRAQRTRHILQTMQADWKKLVEQIRTRSNGGDSASAQQVHVHVHLHVNADGGTVSPRIER
jgi:hypothetical protein